jgi:glycosyltransferase involved in cell wall biosynthesis
LDKFIHLVHSLDPSEGGVSSSVKSLDRAINQLGQSSSICTSPNLLTLEDQKKSLLVAHGLWHWPTSLSLRIKNRFKVPYCIFPHGMLDPWFKKTYPCKHFKKQIYWLVKESASIRQSDAVCFTTEEEMKLARCTFVPYNCEEKVIGLGVESPPDLNLSVRNKLYAQFPSLKTKKILLFMGRFHKKKGVDLLLKSWMQHNPADSILVLAGPEFHESIYFQSLKNHSSNYQQSILWTGMLDQKEKWEMLRLSNALILPSHQENFGMVVAESLAVGKPVYITNKVNLWREVEQANAGVVVNDDQEGINTLVNQWLTQSNTEMRKAAEPCFLQNFHIRKAAENLITLAENIYSS